MGYTASVSPKPPASANTKPARHVEIPNPSILGTFSSKFQQPSLTKARAMFHRIEKFEAVRSWKIGIVETTIACLLIAHAASKYNLLYGCVKCNLPHGPYRYLLNQREYPFYINYGPNIPPTSYPQLADVCANPLPLDTTSPILPIKPDPQPKTSQTPPSHTTQSQPFSYAAMARNTIRPQPTSKHNSGIHALFNSSTAHLPPHLLFPFLTNEEARTPPLPLPSIPKHSLPPCFVQSLRESHRK